MTERAPVAPPPEPAAPIEDFTRLAPAPAAPAGPAETRVGVVLGDRLCVGCGFTLYGQPTIREPHYNLVIVRCPECSTVAALQEYPLLGRWANRWAVLLVGLYLLILVGLAFAGAGVMTAATTVAVDQCGEKYATFIAQRHHDWIKSLDDATLTGLKSGLPQWLIQQIDQQITPQNAAWSWVTDEWWNQQDPRAMFAAAGGWTGTVSLSGLWAWFPVLLTGFLVGMVWSLALMGMRRSRVLPVALVSVALAAVFIYVGFAGTQYYGTSARPASGIAQSQLVVPISAATLVFGALCVALGVWLGRPAARGLVRAMLPPRSRGALAGLWLMEGKSPPLRSIKG